MGGKKDTKKTLEQVQQQLLNTLYLNAIKLLTSNVVAPSVITVEDLYNVISQVGRNHFQNKYGYVYEGNTSKTVPASADGQLPAANEGYASIDSVNDDRIEEYVDTRILSGMELGYVKDAARADLIQLGSKLFRNASNNSWLVQDMTKTYENQDSKDIYARTCHSMFVWTNARLVVGGVEAKYVIIYYLGVYFNVESLSKIVRNDLLTILLKNALALTPIGPDLPNTAGETQRMQSILAPYLKHLFMHQTHYPYEDNMTRPRDMAVGTEGDVRGTMAFCLPQSSNKDDIVNYVNVNVMGAMKLPRYLRNEDGPAYTHLARHFETLLEQTTDNSWSYIAYDKTYDSPNAGENSTRTTAIMVWSKATLTESDLTCNQLYLYYIGVYYRVPNPALVMRDALLNHLIQLAQKLDDDLPDPVGAGASNIKLKAILDVFSQREFLNRIGFKFDESKSTPPDMVAGKKVSSFSTVIFFDTETVSIADARKAVNNSIIGSMLLPSWLRDPLVDTMTTRIKNCTEELTLDSWNSNLFQHNFSQDGNLAIYPYNLRSVITYSNTDMVEDGIKVTTHWIHFLGLLYPTSDVMRRMAPMQPVKSMKVEQFDECIVTEL